MYQDILKICQAKNATLVAVSKTKPVSAIRQFYDLGQRDFGENRVQEMVEKHQQLPDDIKWHQIGHLQKNKVKYIAPFVHLIHSVDSIELLRMINKEASKNKRTIHVLLQVKIATEDNKYGLDQKHAEEILQAYVDDSFPNISIQGLMGMATFTSDEELIKAEFIKLRSYRDQWIQSYDLNLAVLSMGMSGDYLLALAEGSTMVRVGSLIFGGR
jgi:pyridoxal phosphate enzyme (YggS family)